MTTLFYLVRHAAHDNVGNYLAGRTGGVHLGVEGRAQAARLGQRMAREQFDAILASPRERTQETAEAISAASGVNPVETVSALDEVDFGVWAGRTFADLDQDEGWRQWNSMRSMSRSPGGESMLNVQSRIVDLLEILSARAPAGRLVLVSHGDVIKSAVSYVLGLPIDAWPRLEIAPASITIVVTGPWGGKVLTLNEACTG